MALAKSYWNWLANQIRCLRPIWVVIFAGGKASAAAKVWGSHQDQAATWSMDTWDWSGYCSFEDKARGDQKNLCWWFEELVSVNYIALDLVGYNTVSLWKFSFGSVEYSCKLLGLCHVQHFIATFLVCATHKTGQNFNKQLPPWWELKLKSSM